MAHDTLIALSFIGFISLSCQWIAWRIKIPAILFLLISGIVLGPVIGYINPDRLFGSMLMPMISLSVAIILFEGSLTLNFAEVKLPSNKMMATDNEIIGISIEPNNRSGLI